MARITSLPIVEAHYDEDSLAEIEHGAKSSGMSTELYLIVSTLLGWSRAVKERDEARKQQEAEELAYRRLQAERNAEAYIPIMKANVARRHMRAYARADRDAWGNKRTVKAAS